MATEIRLPKAEVQMTPPRSKTGTRISELQSQPGEFVGAGDSSVEFEPVEPQSPQSPLGVVRVGFDAASPGSPQSPLLGSCVGLGALQAAVMLPLSRRFSSQCVKLRNLN